MGRKLMGKGGGRTGFATFISDTASWLRFLVPGGRQSDLGLPLVNIPHYGNHNISGSLFFLSSTEFARPLLPCCGVLHTCAPGRQAPAPCCLKKPP